VTVLEEVLEWSQDRPMWQRDALRRLVLHGELSDEDIRGLSEICKSAHGLAEQPEVLPLTKNHVPNTGSAPVTLISIFHHRGVNALAEGQTLKFARNHVGQSQSHLCARKEVSAMCQLVSFLEKTACH
jgi:hypothetical protein